MRDRKNSTTPNGPDRIRPVTLKLGRVKCIEAEKSPNRILLLCSAPSAGDQIPRRRRDASAAAAHVFQFHLSKRERSLEVDKDWRIDGRRNVEITSCLCYFAQKKKLPKSLVSRNLMDGQELKLSQSPADA